MNDSLKATTSEDTRTSEGPLNSFSKILSTVGSIELCREGDGVDEDEDVVDNRFGDLKDRDFFLVLREIMLGLIWLLFL